jgi:hypothetical protein
MPKRMHPMTDLKSLKEIIRKTWRDEEMASAACYGIDAYAKRWPFVYVINDWNVWDEQQKSLKPEVVAWLEQHGGACDFYHLLDVWGLVGFKNPKAASHFKLRWSGVLKAVPSSGEAWNPHPHNSSFAPAPYEEPSLRTRNAQRALR